MSRDSCVLLPEWARELLRLRDEAEEAARAVASAALNSSLEKMSGEKSGSRRARKACRRRPS